MAEEIVTQFRLDIAQFEQQLQALIKRVESFEDATAGAASETGQLEGELGSASQKMTVLDKVSRQTSKGLEEVSRRGNILRDGFKQVGVELNSAFPAFGKIGNAAKVLGGAFKAALGPVGLILAAVTAAIGGLLAAFGRTQEGADQLRKVTAVLEIVWDRLIGIAQVLGKAIFDAFSNPREAIAAIGRAIQENISNRIQAVGEGFRALGDVITNTAKGIGLSIKGIFDDEAKAQAEGYFAAASEASVRFGNAVLKNLTGVDDPLGKLEAGFNALSAEVQKATDDAAKLANLEIALDNARIAQAKSQGRLNRQFQEQLAIVQNVTATEEERAEAGRQAIAAQNQISKLQRDIVASELAILKLKADQNDTDRDAQLLIEQKAAELEQLEADRIAKSREVQNVLNGIEKQAADRSIAEAQKVAAERERLFQEQVKRISEQDKFEASISERRAALLTQELDQLKANQANELALRVAAGEQIADVLVDQEAKRADLLNQIRDQQITAVLSRFDEEFAAAEAAGVNTADLTKLQQEELEALKAQFREEDAEQYAQYFEALKQTEQEYEEAQVELRLARLDAVQQGAEFLKQLAGDNVAVAKAALALQKAAAIAQIIIQTNAAIQGAINGAAGNPLIAAGGLPAILAYAAPTVAKLKIGAGIAIAQILAQTIAGFYEGGIVGKDGGTKYKNGKDGYLIRAHEGEHIMPTATTRKYLPYLEAMRSGTFERMISTTAALNSIDLPTPQVTSTYSDKKLVGALGGVGSANEQRRQTELLAMIARGLNRGQSKRYRA
jgi:hypothetical protein